MLSKPNYSSLLENILISNQLVRINLNTREMFTETGKQAGFKVGTHEGTSPCDWSLRLVPCSVYTNEIGAGTSPLKKINLERFN